MLCHRQELERSEPPPVSAAIRRQSALRAQCHPVYSWRYPESCRVESGIVEHQTMQVKGQDEVRFLALPVAFFSRSVIQVSRRC
jgi:hypothetical protein